MFRAINTTEKYNNRTYYIKACLLGTFGASRSVVVGLGNSDLSDSISGSERGLEG